MLHIQLGYLICSYLGADGARPTPPPPLPTFDPLQGHMCSHTHVRSYTHAVSRAHILVPTWTLSTFLHSEQEAEPHWGGHCGWAVAMLPLLAASPCLFWLCCPGGQQQRGVGTASSTCPEHTVARCLHGPHLITSPHLPTDPSEYLSTALAPLCPGGSSSAGSRLQASPGPSNMANFPRSHGAAIQLHQQALTPGRGAGSFPGRPQPEADHRALLCPLLFSQHSFVSYVRLSCFPCCVNVESLVSPHSYTCLSCTHSFSHMHTVPYSHTRPVAHLVYSSVV